MLLVAMFGTTDPRTAREESAGSLHTHTEKTPSHNDGVHMSSVDATKTDAIYQLLIYFLNDQRPM